MTYQEQLQAKLSAAHELLPKQEENILDTLSIEEKLVNEIETEFELARYDLDESDILRSIKILDILSRYGDAFSNHKALSILYALAKTDIISVKNLHKISKLKSSEFKDIINKMAKQKLLRANNDKEIELTMDGQSLAERIGFNVFI